MNPQLLNDMTVGNYPLKVDEYLAMGKPVLATTTPTMEMFREYVYLGTNADDYINNAMTALQEREPGLAQQRRAFALSHTWENSVGAIYDAIAQYELSKKG
jgi:glycosyltransferase involved in cell wall biosynthesis